MLGMYGFGCIKVEREMECSNAYVSMVRAKETMQGQNFKNVPFYLFQQSKKAYTSRNAKLNSRI